MCEIRTEVARYYNKVNYVYINSEINCQQMCLNTHRVAEIYRFNMEIWITYRSCLLAHCLQKYLHKNVKSKTSQTYV